MRLIRPTWLAAVSAAALVAFALTCSPPPAQAQADHLKCYKIKEARDVNGVKVDRVNLKGFVDLDGAQFGLEAGCKIKKATKFCVPVTKTVIFGETTVNKVVITPGDLIPIPGQTITDDYICYKIKCDKPGIPTVHAEDQFGDRYFVKFKAFELCGPARKIP